MTPIVLAEGAIAAVRAGRQPQVREVPGPAQLLEPVRDRALPVRPQAFGPEAAGDADVARADGRQSRAIADGRRPDRRAAPVARHDASNGGHLTAPLVNPDT